MLVGQTPGLQHNRNLLYSAHYRLPKIRQSRQIFVLEAKHAVGEVPTSATKGHFRNTLLL